MKAWWRRLWSRRAPLTDAAWADTLATLPFVAVLPAEDKIRLRDLVDRFLDEKEFTPVGGLSLSSELCLNIATQACLPILNLGLSAYADWVGIIVYPDEFIVNRQWEDDSGVVHEYDDLLSGEAWPGGPVILSWQDTQMAGTGYNVVIHEFAHKLDMLNGEVDGIPALHSGLTVDEWERTLLTDYERFCAAVDRDEATRLDPYAAEHPAEFFAVLSEAFFETPDIVYADFPQFYCLLSRYYRQDPCQRHQLP